VALFFGQGEVQMQCLAAQKEMRLDKHNGREMQQGAERGSLIYLKAAVPKQQTNDI